MFRQDFSCWLLSPGALVQHQADGSWGEPLGVRVESRVCGGANITGLIGEVSRVLPMFLRRRKHMRNSGTAHTC